MPTGTYTNGADEQMGTSAALLPQPLPFPALTNRRMVILLQLILGITIGVRLKTRIYGKG
jgi:hypothetical protein